MATRTPPGCILTGNSGRGCRRLAREMIPTDGYQRSTPSIREPAEIADAWKSPGQYVLQKASQELHSTTSWCVACCDEHNPSSESAFGCRRPRVIDGSR